MRAVDVRCKPARRQRQRNAARLAVFPLRTSAAAGAGGEGEEEEEAGPRELQRDALDKPLGFALTAARAVADSREAQQRLAKPVVAFGEDDRGGRGGGRGGGGQQPPAKKSKLEELMEKVGDRWLVGEARANVCEAGVGVVCMSAVSKQGGSLLAGQGRVGVRVGAAGGQSDSRVLCPLF